MLSREAIRWRECRSVSSTNRCRATTIRGSSSQFWIKANRSTSRCLPCELHIMQCPPFSDIHQVNRRRCSVFIGPHENRLIRRSPPLLQDKAKKIGETAGREKFTLRIYYNVKKNWFCPENRTRKRSRQLRRVRSTTYSARRAIGAAISNRWGGSASQRIVHTGTGTILVTHVSRLTCLHSCFLWSFRGEPQAMKAPRLLN